MKNPTEHILRATPDAPSSPDDRFCVLADALASPGYLSIKDAIEPAFVDQLVTLLTEKKEPTH